MKSDKIYILGASGSGTTTLGKRLSEEFSYKHFDVDDYYWLPSDTPFLEKRNKTERVELLRHDLEKENKLILSGCMARGGWGDEFISQFDLIVYLWVPEEIRMQRLERREADRFGISEISENGSRYERYLKFMKWASEYEGGGLDMRSKSLHSQWMKQFTCPILRIEGDTTVDERTSIITSFIASSSA